jgi:hypothetical protein
LLSRLISTTTRSSPHGFHDFILAARSAFEEKFECTNNRK